MSTEAADLLAAALRLSAEEREALGIQLIESLEPTDPPDEVEASWAAEIQRRLEDMEAGRAKMISWEEFRQRLTADTDEVDEDEFDEPGD